MEYTYQKENKPRLKILVSHLVQIILLDYVRKF